MVYIIIINNNYIIIKKPLLIMSLFCLSRLKIAPPK